MALLQFTDSFFPTGAFAHSLGLETYVQDGHVHDRETLESFLRAALNHGIRTGDALAVALTYKATEIEQIVLLDQRLTAMKISRELREGSVKIGKQFLRTAATLAESEMLDEYVKRIQSRKCAGHHAVAYGLVACAAKIDLRLNASRLSSHLRRKPGICRGTIDSTQAHGWATGYPTSSFQSSGDC